MNHTSASGAGLPQPTKIKSSHISIKGVNLILLGLLICVGGFYLLQAFPLFLALAMISALMGTNTIAERRMHHCVCPYCGVPRMVVGEIKRYQCAHCLEESQKRHGFLLPK